MADDVNASGHTISRLESDDGREERAYTVLVTGFGPFLDKFPVNPSWSIASTLPAVLLPTTTHPGAPTQPPIRVLVHPSPLRVSYPRSHAAVPALHATYSHPEPDAVLHIGLAAGRAYFTAERGAAGHVYDKFPDVDGRRWAAPDHPEDDGLPDWLGTGFDVDDVVDRWREGLARPGRFGSPRRGGSGSDDDDEAGRNGSAMNGTGSPNGEKKRRPLPDVRASPDAGNYLCGFTYFHSMAWYLRKSSGTGTEGRSNGTAGELRKRGGAERPVMFMHVPVLPTEEDVEAGREVAIALIRALVASLRERGASHGDL